MAFLKRKPVRVTAYTTHASVAEFYPVASAKKFLPNWWKKLETYAVSWKDCLRMKQFNGIEAFSQGTMKGCYGLRELYNSGIIVPSPADIGMAVDQGVVTTTMPSMAARSPQFMRVEEHNPVQWDGWLGESWQHLKFVFPWRVRCEENLNWLGMQPSFADNTYAETFFVPSGMVPLRYSPQVNINMMVNKHVPTKEFLIPAGEPFWQLIPLTERKIELVVECVTPENYDRLAPLYLSFGKFACGALTHTKKGSKKDGP